MNMTMNTETVTLTTTNNGRDTVILLQCNIDDVDGERLGHAAELLRKNGALDVSFMPLQMKKDRPGVRLEVLARPEDAKLLADIIMQSGLTLGMRVQALDRVLAGRNFVEMQFEDKKSTVKEALWRGEIVSYKVEYEDAKQLAEQKGISLSAARKLLEEEYLRKRGK